MNRDKNGIVIFDDDFRRELMTPKQFALSNKHREEFKKLLAKCDSGEISEQEYNKLAKEMDTRHSAEYDALYKEKTNAKKISGTENLNSVIVANY